MNIPDDLWHSPHGYEEAVWKLDLPTFLQLHERAFRDLGGVVHVIRHDNMTAGVPRACRFDPDSNVRYLAFAAHWGFVPLPTRPYHPAENGKQERSGGYCKQNAYRKARDSVPPTPGSPRRARRTRSEAATAAPESKP